MQLYMKQAKFFWVIRHFVAVEEGVLVRGQIKQHVRCCSLNRNQSREGVGVVVCVGGLVQF